MRKFTEFNKEKTYHVTDHEGKTHEVSAKDKQDAMKKVVSVGGVHPQGIPMSKWGKVKVHEPLDERTLTSAETAKKEEVEQLNELTEDLQWKNHPKLAGKKLLHTPDGKPAVFSQNYVATAVAKKYGGSPQFSNTANKFHVIKEEVEQLDELSEEHTIHRTGTKVSFPHMGKMKTGKVVRHDAGDNHGSPFYVIDHGDYESAKVPAHKVQKLEEMEQLDELTLGKASAAYAERERRQKNINVERGSGSPEASENASKAGKIYQYIKKRHGKAGVDYAHKKATQVKEELEQLDELSKNTLKSYIKKAVVSVKHDANDAGYHARAASDKYMHDEPEKALQLQQLSNKLHKKASERTAYVRKAVSKLDENVTYSVVKDIIEESLTRKHFRQVADIISKHPDASKRKELASHHSEIFSKANPRFDKKRFYTAANAELSEE